MKNRDTNPIEVQQGEAVQPRAIHKPISVKDYHSVASSTSGSSSNKICKSISWTGSNAFEYPDLLRCR